ncbi:MAG: rhodanese-like domain-containing protein, partial [Candidatus Deferrimicrobiaceae bacterium]
PGDRFCKNAGYQILNMGDSRGIFVRKGFVREGGSGMGLFDYFKPVSTWSADEVLGFLREKGVGECNLVDVRQPGEYEGGHLPGARLIPIAELGSRLHELDREKPTITY